MAVLLSCDDGASFRGDDASCESRHDRGYSAADAYSSTHVGSSGFLLDFLPEETSDASAQEGHCSPFPCGHVGYCRRSGVFHLWTLKNLSHYAGVICTLIPVFALLLGILFKGHRVGLKRIAAVLLGLTGAVTMVLTSAGDPNAVATLEGDLLVLFALFSFSCYLVFFVDLLSRYPVYILMKWMFLFASMVMCPLGIWDAMRCDFTLISTTTWLEVFYVVVGGTIFAFAFMLEGQRRCAPEVVGIFNYLQPVVTCALAVAMGLDVFTTPKLLGAALIFLSVGLTIERRKKVS